jgi:hypothetical protein
MAMGLLAVEIARFFVDETLILGQDTSKKVSIELDASRLASDHQKISKK